MQRGCFIWSKIPSDNQIRNLLDPVHPKYVESVYRETFLDLGQSKILDQRRSCANQLLIAMDGRSTSLLRPSVVTIAVVGNGKTAKRTIFTRC